MPVFEYKAIDLKGKTHAGIINAESAPSARQKLRVAKKFPVTVEAVTEASSSEKTGTPAFAGFFPRVTPRQIAIMTRQLATLLGAGFPLVSALDLLVPQTKSPVFKKILARVKDALSAGQSFAQALEQYAGTFSPLYINMVRAGESSGTLEIILDRLAEINEKQVALGERIKTTLAYPLFVSFFGIVVLILLLMFVVPSITSVFADMNQTLPLPTRLLISTSGMLKTYWWLIFLGSASLFILFRKTRKTRRGRFFWDQATLSLPVTGTIVRKLTVARFSRTLGSLLENGVAMLPALETVKNITDNVLTANAVETAAREVEKGQGLGNSLAATQAFPSLSVQMIQVGEQSGHLEKMLIKVADIYENEVESQLLRTIALLEPVMIILIGSLVGFIVLSICLPIFEMSQLVK